MPFACTSPRKGQEMLKGAAETVEIPGHHDIELPSNGTLNITRQILAACLGL